MPDNLIESFPLKTQKKSQLKGQKVRNKFFLFKMEHP